MYRVACSLLLSACASFASAATVSIDTTVDSRDNLYYTNWGHWYTLPSDEALANPASFAAHAVNVNGSGFNFAGYSGLTLTATGSVVDNGPNATDANGDTCNPTCLFNDGFFRKLPAYSLIGIWSSSATEIVPLTDNWLTSIFFVGTNAQLQIPSVTSAYLFLAENDGYFNDNSGHYNVHIEASVVPVPAAGPLMLSGLALLHLVRRRKA